MFETFEQPNLLTVCVEHQLLRHVVRRVVVQLMATLGQTLIDVEKVAFKRRSQLGVPFDLALFDRLAQPADLRFYLLKIGIGKRDRFGCAGPLSACPYQLWLRRLMP